VPGDDASGTRISGTAMPRQTLLGFQMRTDQIL
jgi:hypothetical protein